MWTEMVRNNAFRNQNSGRNYYQKNKSDQRYLNLGRNYIVTNFSPFISKKTGHLTIVRYLFFIHDNRPEPKKMTRSQ